MNVFKKTLPIAAPIIDTYPQHAHLTSILANIPEYLSWIYLSYINIAVKKNTVERLDFCVGYNTIRVNKKCPMITNHGLNNEFIKMNGGIVECVKKAIDSSYYVICMVNGFYIEAYDSYKKRDFFHDAMLLGYSENSFIAADNFVNGKYSIKEITFSQFEDGYNKGRINNYRYIDDIELIEVKKIDWFFSINNLLNNLDAYLYGENCYFNDFNEFTDMLDKDNYAFGLKVKREIITYLQKISINNNINYIIFHALLNHEKILKCLIHFLYDNNYINKEDYLNLIEISKESIAKVEKLVNLTIKYNITKKLEIKKRMVIEVNETFEKNKKIASDIKNLFCIPSNKTINLKSKANIYDKKCIVNWVGEYGTKGYSIIGLAQKEEYAIVRLDRTNSVSRYKVLDQNLFNELTLDNLTEKNLKISRYQSKKEIILHIKIKQDVNRITFYFIDCENLNRKQTIELYAKATKKLLASYNLENFYNGIYCSFECNVDLIVKIIPHEATAVNAVVSALFFD